jgi:hypothetical protein
MRKGSLQMSHKKIINETLSHRLWKCQVASREIIFLYKVYESLVLKIFLENPGAQITVSFAK